MPELPEVETIVRSFAAKLEPGLRLESVHFVRRDLRFFVPVELEERVVGQPLVDVQRRAKYLIFKFGAWSVLHHLGMTGSWSEGVEFDHKNHCHCVWTFEGGMSFVYRDPRRFGYFDIIPTAQLAQCKWLAQLGVEPLEPKAWTTDYLLSRARKRSTTVKGFLMDQKNVVGLGNIYVNEVLFLSHLHPEWPVHRLKYDQAQRLVRNSRQVLRQAIKWGGTTFRDYRQVNGEKGRFASRLKVYERDGLECMVCGGLIHRITLLGRSTYFCPTCQPAYRGPR